MGSILSLRKESVTSGSSVQKCNVRSSAESETNSMDDRILVVLWVNLFAEH